MPGMWSESLAGLIDNRRSAIDNSFMATHVAILLPRYLDLILTGEKTVESRMTITRHPPYRRIKTGERIYFKESSGPYRATAVAGKVDFFDNLTPTQMMALRKRFDAKVCGDNAYWNAKSRSRYATFIELRDVKACDDGPDLRPSHGLAWFTFSEVSDDRSNSTRSREIAASNTAFDIVLKRSAFTTRVIRVPRDVHTFIESAYGGTSAASKAQPIELLMPNGKVIKTDLVRKDMKIRWRGWGPYLAAAGVRVGDTVRFTQQTLQQYLVTFVKKNQTKVESLTSGPRLDEFIEPAEVDDLIARARREDLGPQGIDITSELLVSAAQKGSAEFRSRKAGRLAGAALIPAVARAYDTNLRVTPCLADGAALTPGAVVARITGPLRAILAAERVALNFLTHLSGIATLTSRYVDAVKGTRAGIYDTRKTHVGLRRLEKYAVVCGGGRSHRMGLYDAVLIKDNHIAHLSLDELPRFLENVIAQAARRKPRPNFFMVEVDSLAQLQRVLTVRPCGPDLVLLDNMTTDQLRDAVALRDKLAPGVELEASGGVNLETVRDIALTRVDRISVGAITHSAAALDLGLDIE